MGCNCGKSKKQEWIYTHQGVTTIYTSEVQARAAQIRNSGGTIKVRTK
jgi:hypothetical protein